MPVTIYGGKTVIPLRFVSENLGRRVEWIQAGQYIRVYDKEEAVAPPPAPVATPAPVEVNQEPQWDWSNFVGDWVCEEEGYHLRIFDGGSSFLSDAVFWCDKFGEDVQFSVGFIMSYSVLTDDFDIYGTSDSFDDSNSMISLRLSEPAYKTMQGRIGHNFDGEWGDYPVIFKAV